MYENNHEQFAALNLVSSRVLLAICCDKTPPTIRSRMSESQSFQFTDEVVNPLTFLLISLIEHQSLISYISSTLAQFLELGTDILIAIFVFIIGKHKLTVLFDRLWPSTM